MLTILNPSHIDLCLDLAKNNPGLHKLGLSFNEIVSPEEFYLSKLTNNYTVGWIEDNQLLSIASMRIQEWTWIWDFYGCIKLPYTNWGKTKGHLVLSELFQESLRRKLPTVIYGCRDNFPTILSDATGNLKKKILSWQALIPEISYYHWVDEAKIPAGTSPKFAWQAYVIGGNTAPIDFRIRAGILKQEYREKYIFN